MGANRAPACKTKAYIELDLKLLQETGEIRMIGQPIIAPTITEKVPRGKFEITYTAELFNIMKTLGNKKIEVLSYILDHKDGSNALNMTNAELSAATGISRPTVISTMKILQDAGLIGRKGSVIMVSPKLMVKGNQLREAWLMRRFEETLENTIDFSDSIDTTIDDQYTFLNDGSIVQKAK